MLPPLPKSILSLPEGKYTFQVEAQHIHREHFYSEAQMLAYGRQCIEDSAGICDRFADRGMHPAECAAAIRAMLMGGVNDD